MRKLLVVLMLTVSLVMSAKSGDSLQAVTMVSYEQAWSDFDGTIALKNNTSEDIRNVTYRITYLDMKGKALDYEDLSSNIKIAPGMTKKVNVPAYEHEREYSYYLSEPSPIKAHKFKIKFELKAYNTPKVVHSKASPMDDLESNDSESSDSAMWGIVGVMFALFIVGFYIGMYVLVAVMANRRKRNAALWVLVSLFATPLLAIIILLCLGKGNKAYEDVIQ